MKTNISLKNKNTFRIGGRAKYYTEVATRQELLEVFKKAKNMNLPVFILGEGSNLLVSDNGFNGIVIKLNFNEIEIKGDFLKVGAGVFLRDLVLKAKELSFSGFEWAVGIPGTVGGAIFGNAGALNHSMSELIYEVEVFDSKEIKAFKNKDCFFNYRESIFKKKSDLIILSALFKLKKGKDVEQKIKECLSKRKIIQGYSIGSIFKNPEGYSAGQLIEACNLKGKRVGDAMVSIEHGNWIINLGKATSKEVEDLIVIIKREVKKKFNIDLVEEIRRL